MLSTVILVPSGSSTSEAVRYVVNSKSESLKTHILIVRNVEEVVCTFLAKGSAVFLIRHLPTVTAVLLALECSFIVGCCIQPLMLLFAELLSRSMLDLLRGWVHLSPIC